MCSQGQITVASIDDKVELEATDVSLMKLKTQNNHLPLVLLKEKIKQDHLEFLHLRFCLIRMLLISWASPEKKR